MSTSYYEANRVLDRAFGAVAPSTPGTLYFGLATSAISPSDTGSTVVEPSGGSTAYARASLTNNKTNWGTAASGSLSNLTAIYFAESTASWGTITHVFIADALTLGNLLYYATLSSSRAVASGTTLFFDVAAVVVTMT